MFSPSGTITGSAQTGFTTPGYTITAMQAPDVNGKKWAVTALTGTQAGVTAHSVSSRFDLLFVVPKNLRQLPSVNPTTGIVPNVPVNTYWLVVTKSGTPGANQSEKNIVFRLGIDVPAGVDFNDSAEVRGGMSLLGGLIANQSAGLGDTLISGIA